MSRLFTKALPIADFGSDIICGAGTSIGLALWYRSLSVCWSQWYGGAGCLTVQGSHSDGQSSLTERTGIFCRGANRRARQKPLSAPGLSLCYCHAPAAPAAIGDLRDHRQAAKFEQQFAEAVAFLQVHVHELKGHRLRPRSAHNRLCLNVAYAVGESQAQQRSWRQMAFSGSDSATEIQFRDAQSEVFPQIGGRG